ncbi:GNAT family N-acetyltransferase [Pseudomonas sp. MBLB4136]|uniref:GNAT family N-acetyltransferase n=1 Tax=Pseudomonas sp. MBLB4136 TaxID=3451558 RepID=UPI003F755137
MRPSLRDRVWVAQHQDIIAALCLRPIACGQWLTGLFVAPQQRRQGLARQLIARALAATDGPTWLFCHPQLQLVYQRLGFASCD